MSLDEKMVKDDQENDFEIFKGKLQWFVHEELSNSSAFDF